MNYFSRSLFKYQQGLNKLQLLFFFSLGFMMNEYLIAELMAWELEFGTCYGTNLPTAYHLLLEEEVLWFRLPTVPIYVGIAYDFGAIGNLSRKKIETITWRCSQ